MRKLLGLFALTTLAFGQAGTVGSGAGVSVRTSERINVQKSDSRVSTGILHHDVTDANNSVAIPRSSQADLTVKKLPKDEHEKGKKLYSNKCQFCHGIRGDGKGPAAEPLLGHPVDFIDPKFWEDDAENKIQDTINNGKEMMPAFHLEPAEIKAIIWYMSHTFKTAPQNTH